MAGSSSRVKTNIYGLRYDESIPGQRREYRVYTYVVGGAEGNPSLSKRRLNRERRDPIYLPTEEFYRAVLDACPQGLRRMVEAERLTGLRHAELASLMWRQFDFINGKMEVIGKGNKRRVIDLSDAALRLFRDMDRPCNPSTFIFARCAAAWASTPCRSTGAIRACGTRKSTSRS